MIRARKEHNHVAPQTATIWTLKIKLVFGIHAQGPWEATVQIDSSAMLEDLHVAIQSAVLFSDDHMFTFYAARTCWSRNRTMFEDDDGSLSEMTLAEIFPLPEGQRLFYWFDFGDDWKFSVGRTRAAPQIPETGKKYPRLIGTRGDPPEQYPRRVIDRA
jgi:hypothetical protein